MRLIASWRVDPEVDANVDWLSTGRGPVALSDASRTEAAAVVDLAVAECLAAADAVVVSYSTTGDEAVAMGIPVVCYAGGRPTMSTFAEVPRPPSSTTPAACETRSAAC